MIGQTISTYRIESALDERGRSEVYLAQDTTLPRKVALKILSRRFTSDSSAMKRFQREARGAIGLAHAGLVEVYEFGVHEGRPFVAMEYVAGRTVASTVATSGPLKSKEVVRIARGVAAALEYAHAHGKCHRRIRTSNVMVTLEGEVKLLDLGLSITDESARGIPVGAEPTTAMYWSPELAGGDAGGKPSDIWSLGLLLYEALTGRLPFTGESTASVIQRIQSAPLTKPSALKSGIPAGLERIVLRCLEKDPAQRYQDAGELMADLVEMETPGVTRPVEVLASVGAASTAGPPLPTAPVATPPPPTPPPAAMRPTPPPPAAAPVPPAAARPAPTPPAPTPSAPTPPAPTPAAAPSAPAPPPSPSAPPAAPVLEPALSLTPGGREVPGAPRTTVSPTLWFVVALLILLAGWFFLLRR